MYAHGLIYMIHLLLLSGTVDVCLCMFMIYLVQDWTNMSHQYQSGINYGGSLTMSGRSNPHTYEDSRLFASKSLTYQILSCLNTSSILIIRRPSCSNKHRYIQYLFLYVIGVYGRPNKGYHLYMARFSHITDTRNLTIFVRTEFVFSLLLYISREYCW